MPAATKPLLLDGDDCPWVRGRCERLFLVSPTTEEDRGEKCGFDAGFIAVCPQPDGKLLGVPFICTDHYLRSGLMFSDEVDPALSNRIADAFWNLLLADPNDLPDYEDIVYHLGAGLLMKFGVENGQPFVEATEE